MKIVHINAVYGHGSTGTIVQDIENISESNGILTYIVSPDKNVLKAKRGYRIGNFVDHKFHALMTRITGKQGYFSYFPTLKFLKYLDKTKPDIVHLHNLHSNYINLKLLFNYLSKKDIATVITLHDCWFYTGGCFHYTAIGCNKWEKECGNCPKRKLDLQSLFFDPSKKIHRDREKLLLKIPHLYITGVSNWITEEATKGFLKNTSSFTIRNGIDLSVFKPTPSKLREHLNLKDKKIMLGPASKWLLPINKETLDFFIKNMRKDEILLLYGSSQYDISPSENVKFYGYTKNRSELASLYSIADVFVNPTREDSLSLINIEAQACGVPVVTYDATAPKETVDGINGCAVSVGNYKELLAKSKKFLFHNKYQDLELKKFVKDNFEINNNYLKYLELYKLIENLSKKSLCNE